MKIDESLLIIRILKFRVYFAVGMEIRFETINQQKELKNKLNKNMVY